MLHLRATCRYCYIGSIDFSKLGIFFKFQIKFVITKPLLLEKAVNRALCTVTQRTSSLNHPVT